MLPVTQIDTFYNGLTLRHRDTINAAAGGTFMKRRPEECYDLIENMTVHHNDWDTFVQRSESSSSITSFFDREIVALKAEMAEINKNLVKVLLINQEVKAITHNCKTCGGPHSYNDCTATVGQTQNVTKDTVPPTNNGSTKDVQPSVVQIKTPIPNSEPVVALVVEPVVAPISALKPNPKPSIPYPFADALILMPKFGPTIKSLLTNKEKLFELARTPLNEHCSTVLLENLPENLGEPGKFLIPCDFLGMDEYLALADLGASINIMSFFVWNKLFLLELSPTCMTLELADRSISHPVGVAEDVFVKVGTFHFLVDFVVVDFDADPRYFQEVLGFSVSGNPTPSTKPIVSNSSPTLTPFGDSDFLLKETDAFLAIDDEPVSPEIEGSYYDSEGDILLLEEFLNDDPSSPPLRPQELKVIEPTNEKSSIDEPPVVELKDLPPHLEYAFLEGDDKLPFIIAKDLKDEEKTALIKVLKSHKQALAWQLSDIKGIDLEFCTHKILMEDDFKPAVQHQRRVNLKIQEVIRKEIARLMTRLFEKDTPFFFSKECAEAFQTLKKKLTEVPILVAPDWDLPFDLMCDAGDFAIVCEIFDVWGIDFMGPFMSSRGNKYILVAIDYLSKWVEEKVLPTNDARVVCKFLKSLFARFGTPRAIISDCGTHFCNDQFAKVMLKYGVTHRLATAYHPQTSGQVEVSNRGLKRILERTVGENRTYWSDKLDDALWAFHTAFKTPIGCTPYKYVYGKACHLPIELEHKAYWALKHCSYDLLIAGDHQKVQLIELNKLHDQACENFIIYKEKTKRIHDSKIKDRVFNVGD
uniref:Reverse transcriptase domain-containing protein n=1 Tax=Tanacetum cinerariifolium TaxID=118510 RepID=A0A699HID5_TANCI|nr:reverse transcriptase domain-containing protein [Tanacetum cinerariifolium]